jgi:hypothetical protein
MPSNLVSTAKRDCDLPPVVRTERENAFEKEERLHG